MEDKIKLLLVDDHPIFLIGLQYSLNACPDMEVVGTAVSGEEAIAKTAELKPDVVLLDIIMPGMDGVEVASRLRASFPDASLLMLSSDTTFPNIEKLLNIGIDGFISKFADETTLQNAIRTVAEGYEYYGTDIARLIERVHAACKSVTSDFTERELDIIRLSCQGLQYKEIADKLGIKFKTVNNIKNTIFKKLGINSTVELVIYALKKDIISL